MANQSPDGKLIPGKKSIQKVKRLADYFMDLVLANGTKFFEFSPQKVAVSVVYCARKLCRI